MKLICSLLAALIFSGAAAAQGTRQWKESGYEDFERGTSRGVAIRSTGFLELAPTFKTVYTSPSTYIWSMASDKDGVVYAATGSPARVYRVTPDGNAKVIFEPNELQVQTVVLGSDGAIYAATSPDGKVYRIAHSVKTTDPSAYSAETFFDPKTKYIWSLAFDSQGRLYVATGENGEIYRVDKSGQGSVFFKSDESHIRAVTVDSKDNVIAGSDGSALIYRITPAGEGFVLFGAPRKEITALAVDAAGNIYAAGTGEKRGAAGANFQQPQIINQPGAPVTGVPLAGAVNLSGSDVFMIAPDGAPRKLWSSRDDVVYALDFDATGRLLAGTGNKGRIFAIEKNGQFADLLKASANQVTAFAHAAGGGLYCATSNLGKILLISGSVEAEGTFDSDVQDARIFSRWGRAEIRGHGNFEFFARSGNVDNPDRNWSPWKRVDLAKDARLEVPAARFVQWRAVLKPATPATEIDEVSINYLSRNVAPVVEEVAVQVGARFPPQLHVAQPETVNVNLGPQQVAVAAPRVDVPMQATRDRSWVAARWGVHDDNDDNLVFSVYYRGDNEREWKLLKSGLTDKLYSFDSGLLPDGGYTLKVVASDAPSHTPEEALSDEKVGLRFEVDNTAPRVEALNAKADGAGLRVTFRAADDFSPIKRAEYSVDAGEWQYVEPVGQISDSKTENYDFKIALSGTKGEHVVVVRVYDRYENVATAKSVTK
jgi:hypothetical protein